MIAALKNAEFFGQRIRCEKATDKDYAADSHKRHGKPRGRNKKESRRAEKGFGQDFFTSPDEAMSAIVPKPKKERKRKDASKPKYNGNYDKFKKKK